MRIEIRLLTSAATFLESALPRLEPRVAFMRDCNPFEHPRLGSRRKFLVHLPQPPARHIRVHLRCADAGMAKQLLAHPQVGAVFQQVRR